MNDNELANMSDLELGAIERRVVDEKHRRARAKAVQGLAIKTCRACGKPLVTENYRIADGCPCNSPRGVNHGIVAKATCTCAECDPEQTDSTRYPTDAAKVTIRGQQAETIGGTPYGEHLEPKANGQQKDYIALNVEERAKGFVRPYRSAYVHAKCGSVTSMGRALAETYARDPGFYSGTFCCACADHYPVGASGEFTWDGTSIKVGT